MTAAQVRVSQADLEAARPFMDRYLDGSSFCDDREALAQAFARHRLATAAAPGVPDGWVAVPREPTEAMMDAGFNANSYPRAEDFGWSAMLAAAPTPPTTHQGGDDDTRPLTAGEGHILGQALRQSVKVRSSTHQGGAAEMQEAARGIDYDWLEAEVEAIPTRYYGSPSYDHDAYWFKCEVRDLIAKARALPLPAAEAPQGWQPRIGDRVEPTDDMAYADEWRHEPMYVIGIDAARGRDGLNITVANEWPWPLRGDGGTDGFWIGRSDQPDDIRPAAPSTLREGEGA